MADGYPNVAGSIFTGHAESAAGVDASHAMSLMKSPSNDRPLPLGPQALNALAADGWRHVADVRRQGDFVRASVQDFDGRQRSMLMDPRTGVVLPEFETAREYWQVRLHRTAF
jgi:hypothetical protein